MINKFNIPENYTIASKGTRMEGRHCPHSIPFSSQMSALKVFLGMEQKFHENDGWILDDDYFLQIGISGEAFGLLYNMYEILRSQQWGMQPLKDCLSVWGIKFRLFANKDIVDKDELLNPDTVKNIITEHLLKNLPAIILQGTVCNPIIVGYQDYGNRLIRNYTFAPKPTIEIDQKFIVVLVDGITQSGDKKEIALRSLQRGYEMLTETDKITGEYAYGSQMYEKWIDRLDDDSKYQRDKDKFRYIQPEKFNLAERRAYGVGFFKQVQEILGANLSNAIDSFNIIHNRMWDVHWMAKGDNTGKLLERETRDEVIKIIKECRMLDLKASENIKQVLDQYTQSETDEFDDLQLLNKL